MLTLFRRNFFWPPCYVLYFSHHYTYYKLQSFTIWTSVGSFHELLIALQPIVVTMIPWGHNAPAYSPVGQALLRVLFQGVSLLHGLPWSVSSNLNLINYLFLLKNSRPCWNLNPRPLWYQADLLPTELSWLGSYHCIVKNIRSWKWRII